MEKEQKLVAQLLAGDADHYRLEKRFVTKTGKVVWGDVSVSAIRDLVGRLINFAIVVVDLTASKKAQEQLRFTQFSVDHAQDMVFWIKPDGSFFYVNDQVCKVLGYDRRQLQQEMKTTDLNPEHPPEVWPDHWAELQREGSLRFDTELLKADGTLLPVEISANYLNFEGEEFTYRQRPSIVRQVALVRQLFRVSRGAMFSRRIP